MQRMVLTTIKTTKQKRRGHTDVDACSSNNSSSRNSSNTNEVYSAHLVLADI